MNNNDAIRYIRSHSLAKRIYDFLVMFGSIKNKDNEYNIKKFFAMRLEDAEYVESLANYFEQKIRKYKKNKELRYQLQDLVYELNYLKEYLL